MMDRKSGLVAAVAALLLAAGTATSAAQDVPAPDPALVQRVAAATSYVDLNKQLAVLAATDPTNPLITVMRARLMVLLDAEIKRISAITSPVLLREELAKLQAELPGDPLIALVTERIVVVSQPTGPTRVAFVDTNPY